MASIAPSAGPCGAWEKNESRAASRETRRTVSTTFAATKNKHFPGLDALTRRPPEIRCNFTALFGISELNGEVLVGAHNTVGEAQSVALIANRDRGYYLMYHMLPRELRGADIPQFTAEQRESLAEKHAGDVLQGSFTFGDLYKKRVRSVLVPLQKYAFKRWHFGRIICLGDTMHKVCCGSVLPSGEPEAR